MATSLERFEKKMVKSVIYDQIPIGENFIKIGQVDLEIICLKILKKETRGAYFELQSYRTKIYQIYVQCSQIITDELL